MNKRLLWHKFYIKNKDRFTDSLQEAKKDPNKIYVEKDQREAEVGFYEKWRSYWDDIHFINGT